MTYTIHAAHERIIMFPIIAGPPVSKNGPYFKRCVKFCCKKLQAMIKQSENRKKYTRSNRVCPFRLAIMLAGSLHCVRVTRRLFSMHNKRLPLTTATLSEVYSIWQQPLCMWIELISGKEHNYGESTETMHRNLALALAINLMIKRYRHDN